MTGAKTPSVRFVKIVGASTLAVWLSAAGVSFHFDGTRPEAPDPTLDRIYELSTHGHVVYISFRDGVLLYGMMLGAAVGGITAIVIARRLPESRPASPARYQ